MKKQPIVFMFSGQGSQYFHMGKELFQKEPRFRYWLEKLDDRTYDITGRRVLDSLYNERKNVSHVFDCTLDTHPAIFMVEYALARLVMEKGIQPDGVLGSSLGEFAAAAVAGCLSPETALDLVVNQAQSIESLCPKGAMLTVLHSPAIYNNTPLLYENSTIASVNYSSHFVLSGAPEKLREIAAFLQNQLIDVLLLPVTFAYHSPLIDAARDKITEYSKANRFQAPGIPFISCVSGKSITRFPADYSWRIARATIRFQEALQTLNTDNCFYLDMGPAGTMANFVKNNLKKNLKKDCDNPTDCFSIMTPYGGEIKKISTLKNHLIPVTVNTGDKKNSSKGMPPIETNSSENNSSKKNTREKKKMKVYMFPGQGAQRKGMGKDLFIEFKELTQKASGILGYSIEELCQEDKEGNLVQTQFTQPALYVVNALSYLKKIQTAPKPDYLLGHSIAEYNALFASGVVDFEEGLKMVQKRGLLMSTAAPGGMAAVMGLTEEQVKEIIAKNNSNIYIANINSPHQIALSGLKENIKNAEPAFLDAGATHYRLLKVSGAFHSPLMEESRQQFENYLKQFEFKNQSIPIISNVTARPHKQEHIRKNMIRQITAPVRWAESIRYLLALGIEINDFTELGVKGVSVVKALAIRTNNEAGPLDA
ncbi:MAG: ACP S-malonyltransferase, partial [bacterium]|nr:ACP S-malonyltransferase [bacterium]